MRRQAKELRYFLYSQAFADGFRTTFSILLPALIANYFNQLEIGLAMALGALCTNLADAPGPFVHKKNGMLYCTFFIFLVSVVTALARQNIYTMGVEIFVVCFFFSMFNVYGTRASLIGSAAILVMILTMDKPLPLNHAWINGLFILAGGIWYMAISLLLYKVQPYRIAQRALGECIREMATYLSIKADFYNQDTDLQENYNKMVAQHVVVNEKQNNVREILFKTRQIVQESSIAGRKLVLAFVDAVDMFEEITAAYYDYAQLRQRFANVSVLNNISVLIKHMATELDKMGFAVEANEDYKGQFDFDAELRSLKEQIDAIDKTEPGSILVLKKILVNLRNLQHRFNDISEYFSRSSQKRAASLDHSRFVGHQELDPKLFWNNLSLQSSVFKHSLRVAIASIVGFIIANIISYGHHSYWILMTISFMLKPAFSLTKERNFQRIVGTVIGGIIAILILIFIQNKILLFSFMVLFMLGTYSFQRIKYLAMVICLTPYILILFKFFGLGILQVAEERLLDTAIGCAIAFAAGYFIFPHWESADLKNYIRNMLHANSEYLRTVLDQLSGKQISMLDYKLARKEVYVSSANLSAAFHRMLSEPRSKQADQSKMHQFVVLNIILLSNIATLATSLMNKEARKHPAELITLAKKALRRLQESLNKLDRTSVDRTEIPERSQIADDLSISLSSPDDQLLKDQLEFIYRVSNDIYKIIDHIIVEQTIEGPAHNLSSQAQ